VTGGPGAPRRRETEGTIVYLPLAHWAFDPSGWFNAKLHIDDFAGGTAVETDSGAAALALAAVVGRRLGWPRDQARPHNLPMVMLGAGILWFGWFGFNAGSALAADGLAATAFINTMLAGGAGPRRGRHDRLLGRRYLRHCLGRPEDRRAACGRGRRAPGLDEAEHAETAYDHGRLGPHLSALHSSVAHHETPRRSPASKPSNPRHGRDARHDS
jgi:ammonium transporter family